jgi:hypothetical protein
LALTDALAQDVIGDAPMNTKCRMSILLTPDEFSTHLNSSKKLICQRAVKTSQWRANENQPL